MYFIRQNFITIYFFYLTLLSFFLNGDCSFTPNPTIPNNCHEKSPRDLQTLNSQEMNDFFGSFDTIIADMSALMRQSVSRYLTIRSLKDLQRCHKEAIFIVDDNLFRVHDYDRLFKLYEYAINDNQFIMPSDPLVSYLKKHRGDEKVYVIGSKQFQRKLTENGIKVVSGRNFVNENFNYGRYFVTINDDVKAVIIDSDVNINWNKIAQAGLYLKNKTVQFLAGTPNKKIYADNSHKIIGPGYFQELLINYSGRLPLDYGKSSRILQDYMIERFPTINSNISRTLFIGNSLDTDMKFAYLCGFQKLLIGPDAAELINTYNDCQTLPDYYLSDMSKMRTDNCANSSHIKSCNFNML